MIGVTASADRSAPASVASQRRPSSRVAGIQQLEFSFPRSHIRSAGWPPSARAASRARRAWACSTAGSAQSRLARSIGASPVTVRNRRAGVDPRAQGGYQFTPLMWPVKSVGMSPTPVLDAMSATTRSFASARSSTDVGSGWKSSHSRKIRSVSHPASAHRRKSASIAVASNRRHIRIAVAAGQ